MSRSHTHVSDEDTDGACPLAEVHVNATVC